MIPWERTLPVLWPVCYKITSRPPPRPRLTFLLLRLAPRRCWAIICTVRILGSSCLSPRASERQIEIATGVRTRDEKPKSCWLCTSCKASTVASPGRPSVTSALDVSTSRSRRSGTPSSGRAALHQNWARREISVVGRPTGDVRLCSINFVCQIAFPPAVTRDRVARDAEP